MRVLLVEENEAQVIWLRTMLPGYGIDIVAVAADRAEILPRYREIPADVVLIRNLGATPAMTLAAELVAEAPEARVLVSAGRPADAGSVRHGRLEDLVASLREVNGS